MTPEKLRDRIQKLSKFEETKAMLYREKFVFNKAQGPESETELGRWQKLAFTLYSTICEIDSHINNLIEELEAP